MCVCVLSFDITGAQLLVLTAAVTFRRLKGKGRGSPYSITERRVMQLITVLGSQPAGHMSHKPP